MLRDSVSAKANSELQSSAAIALQRSGLGNLSVALEEHQRALTKFTSVHRSFAFSRPEMRLSAGL